MKYKLIVLALCVMTSVCLVSCSTNESGSKSSSSEYETELDNTPDFAKNLCEIEYSKDMTVAEAFARCEKITNIEWSNYKNTAAVVSGDYILYLNTDIKIVEKINIRFLIDDNKTCRLDSAYFEKISGLTDETCYLDWTDTAAVVNAIYNNTDFVFNSSKYDYLTQSNDDDTASKYQDSNKYNISCGGNNEIAIEAANVFADNYGSSTSSFYIKSIDGSYSFNDNRGTLRVTYDVYSYEAAGGALFADSPEWGSYVSTIEFDCTDYGSYRNYSWYDIPTDIVYH